MYEHSNDDQVGLNKMCRRDRSMVVIQVLSLVADNWQCTYMLCESSSWLSSLFWFTVQQNSVNPIFMGSDRCQTIEYSDYQMVPYWPKLLQVIFCYYYYAWAMQLIRGAFHLDISYICWFWVIRVLFCIFWGLHFWRSWWSRR